MQTDYGGRLSAIADRTAAIAGGAVFEASAVRLRVADRSDDGVLADNADNGFGLLYEARQAKGHPRGRTWRWRVYSC